MRDYINYLLQNPKSSFDAYIINQEFCYGSKPNIQQVNLLDGFRSNDDCNRIY